MSFSSSTVDYTSPEVIGVARPKITLSQRFQKIPLGELAVLFKFMSTLLDAGLPLTRALHFASIQAKSVLLKETMTKITTDIESGSHLSEALSKFPHFFEELVVQMIVVGENSGDLADMLGKVNRHLERRLETRSNLKAALAYPAMLLLACIGVVVFMLTSAVPQLASIFEGMGAELPGITLFFLHLGKFLNTWGWLLGILVIALIGGFQLWTYSDSGKIVWDKLKLEIPFFGDLMRKSAAAQFASTLAILLSGGVATLKSLEVTALAADNVHVRHQLFLIRERVATGEALNEALKAGGLFSDVVYAMTAIGEESGTLDKMLTHVRDIYEQEVELATKTFTRLIEPIMIISMTGIVGVIAASILLPLADLSSAVG